MADKNASVQHKKLKTVSYPPEQIVSLSDELIGNILNYLPLAHGALQLRRNVLQIFFYGHEIYSGTLLSETFRFF